MSEIEKTIKVGMSDSENPTRIYKYEISGMQRLGKEIKISPKSNVTINKPGFEVKFFTESVNICIGIGNDHTADLIMSVDAWEALQAGEPIDITTTKEFKDKYVFKRKSK